MKQEGLTYLKTIGKSNALAATLSDTKPEDDSNDNDDEEILNAFIVTIDPTDGVLEIVDDEEDLKRKRIKTLGLRKVITKSLNRRSSISIITVEL